MPLNTANDFQLQIYSQQRNPHYICIISQIYRLYWTLNASKMFVEISECYNIIKVISLLDN